MRLTVSGCLCPVLETYEDLLKAAYLVDEAGNKLKCCGAVSLTQSNLESFTSQFSTQKDEDKQTQRAQNTK